MKNIGKKAVNWITTQGAIAFFGGVGLISLGLAASMTGALNSMFEEWVQKPDCKVLYRNLEQSFSQEGKQLKGRRFVLRSIGKAPPGWIEMRDTQFSIEAVFHVDARKREVKPNPAAPNRFICALGIDSRLCQDLASIEWESIDRPCIGERQLRSNAESNYNCFLRVPIRVDAWPQGVDLAFVVVPTLLDNGSPKSLENRLSVGAADAPHLSESAENCIFSRFRGWFELRTVAVVAFFAAAIPILTTIGGIAKRRIDAMRNNPSGDS